MNKRWECVLHELFICNATHFFILLELFSLFVFPVAMVSAGGIGGCVTVTRILVNQGRPMYNIDARSLQVACSVLCCIFVPFSTTLE